MRNRCLRPDPSQRSILYEDILGKKLIIHTQKSYAHRPAPLHMHARYILLSGRIDFTFTLFYNCIYIYIIQHNDIIIYSLADIVRRNHVSGVRPAVEYFLQNK